MTDRMRKLVEQASRGESAAVDALLTEHLDGLRLFVRRRAGNLLRTREDSADLVQSTCREILEHLDRFRYRNEAAFKRWLYATALRKIVDRVRYYQAQKRQKAQSRNTDSSAADSRDLAMLQTLITPSRDAMSREELGVVQQAFQRLPAEYREVIVLSRVQGLRHHEIAKRWNRSEGAIRVLLSRALARLATIIDETVD